ncbi:hypothetical protein [Clostridium botulinum]|uniref:hypothetical protein n=1 Tax=Clostridium botulinum TaxID=1491 RepID=UPI0006A4E779|nr:hypothetical protein [Clostridium botulinum]KOC33875.1 hypothetical protein ADU81_08025 [Clostridium botulinum]
MKKMSSYKYLKFKLALESGEKVPRRIKNQILGFKLNENKLRKRIGKLELKIDTWANGYKVPYVEDEFCPKCGCEETYCTGNMAAYPEVWERWYCLRCGVLVAEADNSATIHELVRIKA